MFPSVADAAMTVVSIVVVAAAAAEVDAVAAVDAGLYHFPFVDLKSDCSSLMMLAAIVHLFCSKRVRVFWGFYNC